MDENAAEANAIKREETPWRGRIRRKVFVSALLSRSFLIINLLATIVASYGLLANSTAVVIGAMLIATLLGPISGIALALVDANYLLLRRAIFAEASGALLVILAAFCIGWIHRSIPLSAEILSRTNPNLLDLMIAIAGGAAGGFATINRRLSQGLVGTAIATALVPPLASCGICLAHGETRLGWGAFVLFFANLVAIQFASSVVLWLGGFHNLLLSRTDRKKKVVPSIVSGVIILAMATTFVFRFAGTIQKEKHRAAVRNSLSSSLAAYPGVHLVDVAITEEPPLEIILAVVRTPYSISPNRVLNIERNLPPIAGMKAELHIQSVLVKEVTSAGYLHETHKPEAPEDQLGVETGQREPAR